MDIENHVAERQRLLIKIFGDAPDIAAFDGFEVRQKRAFCQQLVDALQFAVDGAVVDQHVCIRSGAVKGFHLNGHGRKRVFFFALVEGKVFSAREADCLCNVVARLADVDRAGVVDVEKRDGFPGRRMVENAGEGGKARFKIRSSLRLFSDQRGIEFQPLDAPERIRFVAGALNENRHADGLRCSMTSGVW